MSRRNYDGRARRHAAGARVPRGPTHGVTVQDRDGTARFGLVNTPNLLDPTTTVAYGIRDALDPTKASSKPKTFSAMTDEEKAEMRRLYEGKSMRGGGR